MDSADVLSERLMVRSNGADGVFANRRDKKVQQELVRAAGHRAVRQAGGGKFSEVEEFLRTEEFPVVLKPTDSAGSDGVKLCHNFEEAKAHFDHLLVVEAVNGGYNTEVLCQEFLRGKEYVVDTVSRDGEHKCMQVWVYDKRPANGAGESLLILFFTQGWIVFLNNFYVMIAFVYFGMLPIDSSSQEAKLLIMDRVTLKSFSHPAAPV